MEKFVDISLIKKKHTPITRSHIIKKNGTQEYLFCGNPIRYDNRTMGYYKTCRQCKIDPILDIDVSEDIAFKFPYQWDPYTGERTTVDPFGAMFFHPMSLAYYFYIHRLDGLWKNETVYDDIHYDGYYDMLVGTGDELEVVGRNKFPELYLFRIPILDCYLTPDHNKSFVTIGPKLTHDEVLELDRLCNLKEVKNEYLRYFGRYCPCIADMKLLYDNAISKKAEVPETVTEKYVIPQYYYVDCLKNM